MACVSKAGRICVVAASKNTVSSRLASALAMSVLKRAMPCASASAAIFSALRPIRIGSGITRSPLPSGTPP